MADLKLGFKQVILQRIQGIQADSSRFVIPRNPRQDFQNSAQIRQHTDFSINRILGDSRTIKDLNPIDLSKSNQVNQSGHSESETLAISNPLRGTTYYHQSGRSSATSCSENLVKPKVYKFWDLNALANCNGCDRYFKNIAFPALANNGPPLWGEFSHMLSHRNDFAERFVMQSVAADRKSQRPNSMVDDETSHKCTICDKVFGCANTLEAHERTHKAPRYECLDCGKGFSQLRNYKYHLSVHRGTKEFAAECPECGKTFNDKGYLSSHMKIHRNKKEYECPYCPKSFNQRVAFNMHVRIHTGVKPHKCTECGKRFSRKMLLKQHMRTHSGEKPYQCSVCGKSFADRSNMTLHHRLHSGIKPFTCPICPKAFTKKHHLKTHLNYHTGCKPYVCPHPNCNQAFTQSSNMRTHAKKCQFRPVSETIVSPTTPTAPLL